MSLQNTPPQAPGAQSIPSPAPRMQRIELAELDAAAPSPAPSAASQPLVPSLHPLHQVKTTVQVCVGTATLTVGELLGAQAQQVLVLDTAVEQAVDLLVEGQVVARGQLVAVGDRFAVRLTELPTPLGLQAKAHP
ncbi:FliM/FliN family flagellar motor switch protein [Delftia sp. GW456-R20]|jgi:flagellar motor switch protein FliN/FliY|uniref:FliM/FliN family flagellar motor switch protein n=1 Tax=Delftia sp. GW456-R20 TaxID=1827145 RepID=UPI0009ED4C29|nr:FliM/FliN family flagellar motor switch protein [Delftia sp. GW456-R20]